MKPCNLIKASLLNALKCAGGQNVELLRQEKDKNLLPAGERIKVGNGFGAFLRPKKGSVLKIDLPGMLIGESSELSFNYLQLCGESPQKSDCLKVVDMLYKVLSVNRQGFIFKLSVMEEVI